MPEEEPLQEEVFPEIALEGLGSTGATSFPLPGRVPPEYLRLCHG